MINPVSEREAKSLQERLSIPAERTEAFPEPDHYWDWITAIANFIAFKGGTSTFGVEKYRGDLDFFTADSGEEYSIIFLSRFAPLELVFFGRDWMIGISSYPAFEGADTLEYAIRLYGAAGSLGRRDDAAQLESAFHTNQSTDTRH